MTENKPLLLTEKPLCDFTPEEYLAYIRGLFETPAPRKRAVELKWSLTKTGKPSVRCLRKPKWITQGELDLIARELLCPLPVLWKYLKKNGFAVVCTDADGKMFVNQSSPMGPGTEEILSVKKPRKKKVLK